MPDGSARLLLLCVRWAKSVPTFLQLTFRDQAILLEESWSELFVLTAAQLGIPVDLLGKRTPPPHVRVHHSLLYSVRTSQANVFSADRTVRCGMIMSSVCLSVTLYTVAKRYINNVGASVYAPVDAW